MAEHTRKKWFQRIERLAAFIACIVAILWFLISPDLRRWLGVGGEVEPENRTAENSPQETQPVHTEPLPKAEPADPVDRAQAPREYQTQPQEPKAVERPPEVVPRPPPAIRVAEPPIGILERICQRGRITLSFEISSFDAPSFVGIGGPRALEVSQCNRATGQFAIRSIDSNNLPMGEGAAQDYSLSLTFYAKGLRSDPVLCRVGGTRIISPMFQGRIVCTRAHYVLSERAVTIEM
jgi:hypothetical protein